MISLAQTGLMGIAGYALANMVTQHVPGGETKGLPARLGSDARRSSLAILLTVGIGLVFGAVASRSFGIYFLMLTLTYTVIAFLFVGSVTLIGGFSPVAGVDRYTPGFIGDIVNDRQRLYYIALITAVVVYVLIRYLVRTPFGISLQGIRDEPDADGVARLQRRAASDARLRHRRARRRRRRCAVRLVVRAALARRPSASTRRSSCS